MDCRICRAPKWSLLLLSSLIFFTTQTLNNEAAAQQQGGGILQGLQFEIGSSRSTDPLFGLFSFQERDSEIECSYTTPRSPFGFGEEFRCSLSCDYSEESGELGGSLLFELTLTSGPAGRLLCRGSCDIMSEQGDPFSARGSLAYEWSIGDSFNIRDKFFGSNLLEKCGVSAQLTFDSDRGADSGLFISLGGVTF